MENIDPSSVNLSLGTVINLISEKLNPDIIIDTSSINLNEMLPKNLKNFNLTSESTKNTSQSIRLNPESNLNIKIETTQIIKTTITIEDNTKVSQALTLKTIEEMKSENPKTNFFKSLVFRNPEMFSYPLRNLLLSKNTEEVKVDLNNKVVSNSEENHFFVCGELENPEMLSFFSGHDYETILRYIKWVIAEELKVFFTDRCFVRQISSIRFEEFKNLITDKRYGRININTDQILAEEIIKIKNISNELKNVIVLAVKFYLIKKPKLFYQMVPLSSYFCFSTQSVNMNEYHMINSYLYSSLSILPLYWGRCTRFLNLSEEDLKIYQPGRVICWLGFVSSFLPETKTSTKKNTIIEIISQTGRKIKDYENNLKVIFLPLSHFMVLQVQKIRTKTKISLIQLELGIAEKNILWVDDNIHDSSWGNKTIIENSFSFSISTRFILKSSTDAALAYLESIWGQEKKKNPENFRIISDMNRLNEVDGQVAGAKFMKEVLNLGFTCNLMIYSSSVSQSQQKLARFGLQNSKIIVSNIQNDALDFITFKYKIS